MKKLENIYLSNNEIANVKDGAFDNLPELEVLHLNGNPITEYASIFFNIY